MDPITHAALGAACAQAFLGKYDEKIPWRIGALAAMAPDLDIFIISQDPLGAEFWHRNFTHAFTFIPVGGLLVALFFLCFSYFRKAWKITLAAALIGYATHGLLDAMTAYGTMLYWPWSNQRVSWDIVAIIDPVVTIPLIIGIAWTLINHTRTGVFAGLCFVAVFFLCNAIQHQRAIRAIEDYASQQHWNLTRIRAMPDLASSTRWRTIAKHNQCLFIADTLVPFGQSVVNPIRSAPLVSNNTIPFSLSPGQKQDLVLFSWFSDDYVIVANQDPLILADGRYTWGSAKSLFALWGIQLLPEQAHCSKLRYIELSVNGAC